MQMTSRIGKRYLYSAFTLLETIIVLAIMTMFFAISIPLFSRFTEKTKLDTAARSIVSALRTARTYAITNNAVYFTVFDTNVTPNEYFVSSDSATPVEKSYRLPVGISFVGAIGFTKGANGQSAAFNATGELDENLNDTTLTLSDAEGNLRTITVERTTGRTIIQ
jgi:type II secretory pathway pseudopilin PulG